MLNLQSRSDKEWLSAHTKRWADYHKKLKWNHEHFGSTRQDSSGQWWYTIMCKCKDPDCKRQAWIEAQNGNTTS